jgi:hypothetical protein
MTRDERSLRPVFSIPSNIVATNLLEIKHLFTFPFGVNIWSKLSMGSGFKL